MAACLAAVFGSAAMGLVVGSPATLLACLGFPLTPSGRPHCGAVWPIGALAGLKLALL